MCGREPEKFFDKTKGEVIISYWVAQNTKESLCIRDNQINDQILLERGKKERGIRYDIKSK